MGPSDAALAAAFREALIAAQDDGPTASPKYATLCAIHGRARELDTYQSPTDSAGSGSSGELDAAKGGEAKPHVRVGFIGHVDHGKQTLTAALMHISKMEMGRATTPPTQPGDAVEAVARALARTNGFPWQDQVEAARAAIAAMPASGEGVDAARYRWLRDLPEGSPHEQIGNFPGDMWDAAIDAARGEGNG